jgi:hypothetical protein
MGTHAAFWVGLGPGAEWIGGIRFDGYPSGVPARLLTAGEGYPDPAGETTGAWFREEVAKIATFGPPEPWPWPWQPQVNDWSYAWADGTVWLTCCDRWRTAADYRALQLSPEDEWGSDAFWDAGRPARWPSMPKTTWVIKREPDLERRNRDG